MGHGKWLKIKSLSRPALVKVDHPSTLTAGEPPGWKPDSRQIRTFWCPVGMHNHASSQAIGAGTAVLIVSPELRSRARWDVVNKP